MLASCFVDGEMNVENGDITAATQRWVCKRLWKAVNNLNTHTHLANMGPPCLNYISHNSM